MALHPQIYNGKILMTEGGAIAGECCCSPFPPETISEFADLRTWDKAKEDYWTDLYSLVDFDSGYKCFKCASYKSEYKVTISGLGIEGSYDFSPYNGVYNVYQEPRSSWDDLENEFDCGFWYGWGGTGWNVLRLRNDIGDPRYIGVRIEQDGGSLPAVTFYYNFTTGQDECLGVFAGTMTRASGGTCLVEDELPIPTIDCAACSPLLASSYTVTIDGTDFAEHDGIYTVVRNTTWGECAWINVSDPDPYFMVLEFVNNGGPYYSNDGTNWQVKVGESGFRGSTYNCNPLGSYEYSESFYNATCVVS